MNRADYRAAVDAVEFRPEFQRETVSLLRESARRLEEQEHETMNRRSIKKVAVLTAAAIALLAVSAAAVMLWLTPAQMAEESQDPLLADAFQSADAIALNETAQAGEYTVTLAGLVSGKSLSVYERTADGQVMDDRTYAAVILTRTDGTPLTEQPDGLTFSPLVAGYPVWQVNGWTLEGGWSSFIEDGTAYYLFDTQNLEMFADQTVYLAVYEGNAPSPDIFDMAEDGAISYTEEYANAGALFTLPLDGDRANPAAVEEFMKMYEIQED